LKVRDILEQKGEERGENREKSLRGRIFTKRIYFPQSLCGKT